MKHTKKIAAVLIAALCAAQLAACGSRSAEAVHISTANVDAEAVNTDGALVIAEQGMFSAGGITVTSDGIFAPENQWEETGAGQTAHVDHANVFLSDSTERDWAADGVPPRLRSIPHGLDDNS